VSVTAPSGYRHPADALAPPDVVRALQAVDPRADLFSVGRGNWMLVIYNPLDERQERGRRELAAITARGNWMLSRATIGQRAQLREYLATKIAVASLKMAGYQQMGTVWSGEPDSRIVNWLRDTYARAQNKREQDREREMAAASEMPEDGGQAMKDLLDEDRAKDAWHDAFSGAHSVTIHNNPLAKQEAVHAVE